MSKMYRHTVKLLYEYAESESSIIAKGVAAMEFYSEKSESYTAFSLPDGKYRVTFFSGLENGQQTPVISWRPVAKDYDDRTDYYKTTVAPIYIKKDELTLHISQFTRHDLGLAPPYGYNYAATKIETVDEKLYPNEDAIIMSGTYFIVFDSDEVSAVPDKFYIHELSFDVWHSSLSEGTVKMKILSKDGAAYTATTIPDRTLSFKNNIVHMAYPAFLDQATDAVYFDDSSPSMPLIIGPFGQNGNNEPVLRSINLQINSGAGVYQGPRVFTSYERALRAEPLEDPGSDIDYWVFQSDNVTSY